MSKRVDGYICRPLSSYFEEAFKASENAKLRGGLYGLTTGFAKVDEYTAGLGPGQLWTIGGGTGSGKSSLALAIARKVVEAGVEGGTPDIYFASLEMGPIPLVHRLAAMSAGINLIDAMKGALTISEWQRYAKALSYEKTPATFIHVDTRDFLKVEDIREQIGALKSLPGKATGVRLAIVDYMQLVSPERGLNNREREVAEVVRGLKGLAMEFGIPIVGCSQFNRDANKPGGGEVDLRHLRESGEIEQASDVVILICGPEGERGDLMNMKIAKNRQGPKASFQLAWNAACTRFADPTPAPYEDRTSGGRHD